MTDAEITAFLQWALPRLHRRWAGYRKVRGLVAKRLKRRLRTLGLADLSAYRGRLDSDVEEWRELERLLGIPISRFYRDRGVFDAVAEDVLPVLANAALSEGRAPVDCWSAGCASGEEPYTLAILWRLRLSPRFPELGLRIVATDNDTALLERAHVGCYPVSSLKELPPDLCAPAFERRGDRWCVRDGFRTVDFMQQDLREQMPVGPFDLVLCRSVIATYYAPEVQREIFGCLAARLRPGAALVLGLHEVLPDGIGGFTAWLAARAVFRKN